ncbi:YolD-like family protein [Lysinibacillus sp. MHQ-1]|nr:YolD-like family protein [Lysinibacillus sp. MHQ-1]
MIKDRGNIKWASMMMPEHLDLLRECKEVYTTQPRELTEWELEELQQTIDTAYQQQQDVQLNVWSDGKSNALDGNHSYHQSIDKRTVT